MAIAVDEKVGIAETFPDTLMGDEGQDIALEGADAMRVYLQSASQHPLLTKEEEVELGCAAGSWMLLKELRSSFQDEHGRPPRPAELGTIALRDLGQHADKIEALAHTMGAGHEAGVAPEVRATIDRPLVNGVKASGCRARRRLRRRRRGWPGRRVKAAGPAACVRSGAGWPV